MSNNQDLNDQNQRDDVDDAAGFLPRLENFPGLEGLDLDVDDEAFFNGENIDRSCKDILEDLLDDLEDAIEANTVLYPPNVEVFPSNEENADPVGREQEQGIMEDFHDEMEGNDQLNVQEDFRDEMEGNDQLNVQNAAVITEPEHHLDELMNVDNLPPPQNAELADQQEDDIDRVAEVNSSPQLQCDLDDVIEVKYLHDLQVEEMRIQLEEENFESSDDDVAQELMVSYSEEEDVEIEEMYFDSQQFLEVCVSSPETESENSTPTFLPMETTSDLESATSSGTDDDETNHRFIVEIPLTFIDIVGVEYTFRYI